MNRMLKWFRSEHLPPELRQVSLPVQELAQKLDTMLAEGPEKTAGMRKLLEAKDCFVRALLEAKESGRE